MLIVLALAWALEGQTAPSISLPSACEKVVAAGVSGAAVEGCRGEEALRRAEAMSDTRGREQQFQVAARHLRQAANLARELTLRTQMLELLSRVFERTHLHDPDSLEQVLRELLAIDPYDLSVVERLARNQEERGMFDAAENLLLTARAQQPELVEPYKLLAQFYARRVTAIYDAAQRERTGRQPNELRPEAPPVNGAFEPPVRRDRPVYPPAAKAAGISGTVAVEVLIDEQGNVIDAHVVRSIPLLDEEALRAVREWKFVPAVVNGKPQQIRMTTTVNFTDR